MNKSELLRWLQESHRQWETLLDQVGPQRMEQPGVNGDWSMKDIVAHLTGWNLWLLARLQAAKRGETEPPPPWPSHLETEDEINTWIYEFNCRRSQQEILDESHQVFRQILAVIQDLPDDVRIDEVWEGHAFYLVWVNGKRYHVGEYFDHFRDDHEPDMRAWLGREEKI